MYCFILHFYLRNCEIFGYVNRGETYQGTEPLCLQQEIMPRNKLLRPV